jgi:hypothetical protein
LGHEMFFTPVPICRAFILEVTEEQPDRHRGLAGQLLH